MELIEKGEVCYWAERIGKMLNKKTEIYREQDPCNGHGQWFPPRYVLYIDGEIAANQKSGLQNQRFLFWLRGYHDALVEYVFSNKEMMV